MVKFMEIMNIVNNVIKMTFVNICTYLIFIKLINYKHNNIKKTAIILAFSLAEEIISIILVQYIGKTINMAIMYLIHSIVIARVTDNKIKYSIIVVLIALTITYLIYLISIILSSIILKIFIRGIQENSIIILFVGIIIENILIYEIFKIKRFKNGVAFLKDTEKVNNIGLIGFALIGFAMLIYSTLGIHRFTKYIVVGIIIETICMTIWISKKITKYYKQKLKEQTIEELENEIVEKNEEINKVIAENEKIATINHKYSNRIQALEKFSHKIASNPKIIEAMKTEFGEEFTTIQKQIETLSEEFSNETSKIVKQKETLEKTGIFGIDNILEYMKGEAEKDNIKFNLKINGNINYMVEKVIKQSKLETLLGDHIKDAIIAIKSSNNSYRNILVIIGIIENCYEICIYDTGIEFEIETLLKLGLETITTHKDTGGTGIGFMTTFEILKDTKASLIIEEKHPMNDTDYTKAVIIRFDGKNEYKIYSYRADEIKKQKKDNRIIVQNIL